MHSPLPGMVEDVDRPPTSAIVIVRHAPSAENGTPDSGEARGRGVNVASVALMALVGLVLRG